MNEETVIGTDDREHHPDRVVVYPDRTVVVDYKSGSPDKSYKYQILNYVDLYRRMGYKNVCGFIWYVFDNTVDEIR